MPKLYDQIARLVEQGRYVIGEHAWERLLERGIMEWQIIAGMSDARLLTERPLARPNPIVEVRVPLPDGDECKAVSSWLRQEGVTKLVTAHLLDEDDLIDKG